MPAHIHLEGKTALITGASRGIGEAIARVFAQSGAKIAIASRKEEGIKAAAERLSADGAEVLPLVCHAGYTEQIETTIDAVIEHFGQLDVLVNNAATNPHFGPLVTADRGAWDKTMDVNLRGYFDATRLATSHWVDRGLPGSVINVASVVALSGAPLQGVYAMFKAAVLSMTKTLAVELGPSRIRVNAVAPGLVDTRFASALVNNPDIVKRVLERTPLGRVGQPEDIAGAVLYLASDAASFVSGHTMVVDGGLTSQAM